MTANVPLPVVDREEDLVPSTRWHLITGEYPPQPGGVSAYTRLLARAFAAAGDEVDVWAPPCSTDGETDSGVTVHRLPDHFGPRSLRALDRALDELPGPRRLLVQYVPHAFGWKAANVPFCWWLRSRRDDPLWVMFHEVAYPTGRNYSARENALGAVTRWMATLVSRAAERIFVSIPAWQQTIESLTSTHAPITWLPIPSTIAIVDDSTGSARIRARVAGDRPLLGHIGTYGRLIRPALEASLIAWLEATDGCALLLGRNGDVVRAELISGRPGLADRIVAPGGLSDADLSRHVAACDLMIQPYPDGISTRRTSAMVALAHRRPVVTTTGWLSEPFWSDCGAVVLAAHDDPLGLADLAARLSRDRPRLAELSARARALYDGRFALSHTVDRLRHEAAQSPRSHIQ